MTFWIWPEVSLEEGVPPRKMSSFIYELNPFHMWKAQLTSLPLEINDKFSLPIISCDVIETIAIFFSMTNLKVGKSIQSS